LLKAFLFSDGATATAEPTSVACLESRGWFTRADSTPFAIVSFRLSTMTDHGHPPRIVQSYLQSYFTEVPSACQYFQVLFSIDSDKAVKDIGRVVTNLIRKLKK
jgi:hypothetical protein